VDGRGRKEHGPFPGDSVSDHPLLTRADGLDKRRRRRKPAYQAKERDVLSRAKGAYAMLYLSHHAIHIFKENADLMRQFSKVAEARFAAGKASQSDALKAQVELSKMLNELVSLQQEKETNAAMLNTLLNRAPESPLGIPRGTVRFNSPFGGPYGAGMTPQRSRVGKDKPGWKWNLDRNCGGRPSLWTKVARK
jgi:hypothetical protein